MLPSEIKKLTNTKGKTVTANGLTQSVIRWLGFNGFVAWRNNNGAVYDKKKNIYRKNPAHKLGVPDVIGYRNRDGKFVAIEIKVGKDELSIWQKNFILEAKKNNCIAMVVRNLDEFIFEMQNNNL